MPIEMNSSSVNDLPSKIEVTKNTKGYTWTIRLTCKDGEESSLINRIEDLNKELINRFKAE